MLSFILNQETIHTDMPAGVTVLDFIRYHKQLKGTKIGCREGDCGACTVMVGKLNNHQVEYQTMTSCLMPLGNAAGKHIVTIEGINRENNQLTPVQQALVDENGSQCGFCTVGFVMSLTCHKMQSKKSEPSDAMASVDGNICRCTGYKSIERAAMRLHQLPVEVHGMPSIAFAVEQNIIPPWFLLIGTRLAQLQEDGEIKKSGNRTMIMSGGTDLYVQHPEDLSDKESFYAFDESSLKGIEENQDLIVIGGSATVTDMLESSIMNRYFPDLGAHFKLISSTPIRNMATVAGNIVNASPIGDITVFLLALQATVVLRNDQVREIPLCDFYEGYKKLAKHESEIVEKIYFKKPGKGHWFHFEKISKRRHLDIATVNTAILLRVENGIMQEACISCGGVSPIPLYLRKTSAYLLQHSLPLDGESEEELFIILQNEIQPISDVRGSAEYKRILLRQLIKAHLIEYQQRHA